jgi:hypothetical protein
MGDRSTPARRVFGYLEDQPVETIWWSRELAGELFASGGSAEALANGVALRTSGFRARRQEQLAYNGRPRNRVAERDPRRALQVMTELHLDTVRLASSRPNVDRARTWVAAGVGGARLRLRAVLHPFPPLNGLRLFNRHRGLRPT